MADEFWVAAYVLAGIIVIILVFKFYEWLYEHDMDSQEQREYELLSSAMANHPGMKAFSLMLMWVFWPLIVLATLVFSIWILIAAIRDGLDWLWYKVRK